MAQNVLITGVSSGIGYATAQALIGRGFHVFGSVRRAADAERVAAALGHAFSPLVFDVTDTAAVAASVAQVQRQVGNDGLAGLVNNAGITVLGPLMHLSLDQVRRQFEVNLFGLLDVTQRCLPLLGARPDAPHPPGRIVNVGSTSGQIAYPFFGPYAASKHALEGMSDALRRELMLYGVDVILIQPGTTATPLVEKSLADVASYGETAYGSMVAQIVQDAAAERRATAIPVERVSGVIVTALTHPRPRARYPIPRRWLASWLIPRWLPDRWLDRVVAARLGIRRR